MCIRQVHTAFAGYNSSSRTRNADAASSEPYCSCYAYNNARILSTVVCHSCRGPKAYKLCTTHIQLVSCDRCRIGHSRLTHEFLLKGEPPPECIPCNCLLTIKHLLIECVDFNDVRQRFYQVPSLQDLFKTVKPEVILEFLKAAALYRLL